MDDSMNRYLTLKAALLEPETLNRQMDLTAGTANLLVQLVLRATSSELGTSFAPITFPLSSGGGGNIPAGLKHVPEFFIDNLCEHLLLAKRFKPAHF